MQEAIERIFEDMDTNRDGKISRSEWMAAQEAAMQNEFRRVDRDGNGTLTRQEIRSDLEKIREEGERMRRGARPNQ